MGGFVVGSSSFACCSPRGGSIAGASLAGASASGARNSGDPSVGSASGSDSPGGEEEPAPDGRAPLEPPPAGCEGGSCRLAHRRSCLQAAFQPCGVWALLLARRRPDLVGWAGESLCPAGVVVLGRESPRACANRAPASHPPSTSAPIISAGTMRKIAWQCVRSSAEPRAQVEEGIRHRSDGRVSRPRRPPFISTDEQPIEHLRRRRGRYAEV